MANPEILKRVGGGRQYISPSFFIANAHNEPYTFYAEKGDLMKQILRPIGVGRPPPLWIRHCLYSTVQCIDGNKFGIGRQAAI